MIMKDKMNKLQMFGIYVWQWKNFLNEKECDKMIGAVQANDLRDYHYLTGNAKTTMGNMGGGGQNHFLDFHKDIEDKIGKEWFVKDQRMSESWLSVQGKGSKLQYHCHPNSIISGLIYLRADEKSSKLFFQNPMSLDGETWSIQPETGMMLMWPSFLMHGSGTSINESEERIVLGFNSYWKGVPDELGK